MDADRSAREREYHNARVEHEIRDAQGKYYAAIKHGSFDSTIGSLMAGADVLEYGCGNLPVLLSLPPSYQGAVRSAFDLARRNFQGTPLSFFALTMLLSVPFRDTRAGDAILRLTARMDRCLFHLPGLKWQAWYCQMILVR